MKKECPNCGAEMDIEFLCHDEPRFDGTAVWLAICYECDLCIQKPVPNHLVNYYREKFGFIMT